MCITYDSHHRAIIAIHMLSSVHPSHQQQQHHQQRTRTQRANPHPNQQQMRTWIINYISLLHVAPFGVDVVGFVHVQIAADSFIRVYIGFNSVTYIQGERTQPAAIVLSEEVNHNVKSIYPPPLLSSSDK